MGHIDRGCRGLVLFDRLEPRMLFAGFALADYFPAKPGYTWRYSGESSGTIGEDVSGSDLRTIHTDTTAGASVRFDDKLSGAGQTLVTSRYYSFTSKGAFLNRQDNSSPGFLNSAITFDSPIHFLNHTLEIGDRFSWKKAAITANVSGGEVGKITAHGTDSGTSTVVSTRRFTFGDGKFIDTLKVVLDHVETYTVKVQGISAAINAHIIESVLLAPGIGLVEGDGSIGFDISGEGESDSESFTSTLSITSSNLLPSFNASSSDGVLQVTGSDAGDNLSVTASRGQLLVRSAALTQSFDPTGISSIMLRAADGNDKITIAAGTIPAYVDAGTGNDLVFGGDGKDTFTGGAGKDTLYGGNNDDRLNGNGSSDILYGQAGNDRLYGGDGDDQLDGGGGVDRLFAGAGNDALVGGGSNDKLYGEEDSDVLYGGAGADLIDGGAGKDKAQNDPLDSRVSIASVFT